MKPGYICVAGIDTTTQKHVRPTLFGRISDEMAATYGGVFAIGGIVELGNTKSVGSPPEVEDEMFDASQIKRLKNMSASEFWKLLKTVSKPTLNEIFGKDLVPCGRSCAVAEGKGIASLGCLIPQSQPKLSIEYDKLCVYIENGESGLVPKINDLRLHARDGTILSKTVDAVVKRLDSGEPVILSVGLARAYTAPNDTESRHWLQVNNIHFESDLLG
jgi:hypothetical protein